MTRSDSVMLLGSRLQWSWTVRHGSIIMIYLDRLCGWPHKYIYIGTSEMSLHYLKIDKYAKYWENISVGNFPMDFPDGNIPSIYTEGITVEKNLKQSKEKRWRVIYTNKITNRIYVIGKIVDKLWTLFIMSITKGITNGKFRRYFPESSGTVHFPISLLIIVLYR
jgi:hypothetical protein